MLVALDFAVVVKQPINQSFSLLASQTLRLKDCIATANLGQFLPSGSNELFQSYKRYQELTFPPSSFEFRDNGFFVLPNGFLEFLTL